MGYPTDQFRYYPTKDGGVALKDSVQSRDSKEGLLGGIEGVSLSKFEFWYLSLHCTGLGFSCKPMKRLSVFMSSPASICFSI